MSSLYQPKLQDLVIAVVPWFIMMFTSSIIRLEKMYWVNMTILAAIYPALIYYLGQRNLLLGMTSGSMFVTLAVSMLALITLTEGVKWQKLKKGFKEFGKDSKQSAMVTSVMMVTTLLGLLVAYYTNPIGIIQM
jgi:hypothetical protein